MSGDMGYRWWRFNLDDGLTIDFDEWTGPIPVSHYCFRVGEDDLDAILARIEAAGIPCPASDPFRNHGGMMRPTLYAKHALLAVAVAMTAGCASYRTSSNIESTPEPVAAAPVRVLLAEDRLPGRKYTELGPIEVSVKKLTLFHADPTKEQANEALIGKARQIGANAVIGITYESGIGFTTWGYIDAKGIGVKLAE